MTRRKPREKSAGFGRRRWLRYAVLAAGALAALLVAALLLTTYIRNPSDEAAKAAPPAASVLTASVERKVLKETTTLRGTVQSTGDFVITNPASADSTTPPVITAMYLQAGADVQAGTVIAQISGRPLIGLVGKIPAYRDLKPSDVGPDVLQLQNALQGLYGIQVEPTGIFDQGTEAALESLYRSLGYEPPETAPPGSPQHDALRAASQELLATKRTRDANAAAADAALSAANQAQAAADVADNESAEAAVTLQTARNASAETPPVESVNAAEATQAKARAARLAADQAWRALDAAKQQVDYDDQAVSDAQDSLTALQNANGTAAPMAEFVFVSQLPAVVQSVAADVGKKLTATDAIATLATGTVVVNAMADSAQAESIKAEQKAVILDVASQRSTEGRVSSVGGFQPPPDEAGDSNSTPEQRSGFPITIVGGVDRTWANVQVRVSIEVSQTASESLVVPTAAISSDSDGRTYVRVYAQDLPTRPVYVTVEAVFAGEAAVAPVATSLLATTDRVVVG